MQKNYLTISLIVTILGVTLIFLPSIYTINLAPEQVTLWEDTYYGTSYSFNTGTQSIDEGVSPYVKVWSESNVTLNTLFHVSGMGETATLNTTDNPSEYLLPSPGDWDIEIEGEVVEDEIVTVNAGFYYLKQLEPEKVRYYPYRFFGYGMTVIGAIASLLIYTKTSGISLNT